MLKLLVQKSGENNKNIIRDREYAITFQLLNSLPRKSSFKILNTKVPYTVCCASTGLKVAMTCLFSLHQVFLEAYD